MASLVLFQRTLITLIIAFLLIVSSNSFALHSSKLSKSTKMSLTNQDNIITPHPFCQLPGDPSLILTTNVDLGDKKLEIMKGKVTYA